MPRNLADNPGHRFTLSLFAKKNSPLTPLASPQGVSAIAPGGRPEEETGRIGELLRDLDALYRDYSATLRAEVRKSRASGIGGTVLEAALARTLKLRPDHPVGFLRSRMDIEARRAADGERLARELAEHEERKRSALAPPKSPVGQLVRDLSAGTAMPEPPKPQPRPIEKPRPCPNKDRAMTASEAVWATDEARSLINSAYALAANRADRQGELTQIRHSGSPADMRELLSRWQATDGPRPDDAKPDLNAGSGGHSGRALKSRGGDEDDACNH